MDLISSVRHFVEDHTPRQPQRQEGWWDWASSEPDPLSVLLDWRRGFRRHQLITGIDGECFGITDGDPDSPMLAIGPPGASKSAALAAINIMLAPGFVLSMTPRLDMFMATSRPRSRYGTVYSYSARGTTLPGAIPLSWSPLLHSTDFTEAQKEGQLWASMMDRSEYAVQSGMRGHPHFRARATALLGSLFYIAASLDYDMGWVYKLIVGPGFDREMAQLRKDLSETLSPELEAAFAELGFLARIGPEERGGIFTTTANALGAYRDPKVVEASRNPNMDCDALVTGRPDQYLKGCIGLDGPNPMRGAWDTLYIFEGNSEDPTAFIYQAVEYHVRDAIYKLSRKREVAGLPRPMPITVVNDDAAVFSPVRLFDLLAEGRDRGVNTLVALQSLSQARTLFGELGADFLTLFRTALVFRGIKDMKTLEPLSMLAGKYWQAMSGSNFSYTPQGFTSGENLGYQELPVLRPDQIAQGHPDWPDGLLVLPTSAKPHWVIGQPYFRGEPWARLIISSLERNIYDESLLPLPPLAKDGSYEHLQALGLVDRFKVLQDRYQQF